MGLGTVKIATAVLLVSLLGVGLGAGRLIDRTQAAEGADAPVCQERNAGPKASHSDQAKEPPGPDSEKVARVQLRIAAPEQMAVTFPDADGRFGKTSTLAVPGRVNLKPGQSYRLKLTQIPNRPGLELYPSIEVPTVAAQAARYVSHNAVPLAFTAEDFDHAVQGKTVVTRVVYLAHPAKAENEPGEVSSVASYEVAGKNVQEEAGKRGTILVIVELGNIDLEAPPIDPVKPATRQDRSAERKGVVQEVKDELILISLGSRDGLKPGDTLEVYRTTPQPVYCGRIRLIAVEESRSVARLATKAYAPIQVNDAVASKLSPR